MNKFLISLNSFSDVYYYKDMNYLLALDDFCVGYKTFSLDKINTFDKPYYLLVNRLLDNQALIKLERQLSLINPIYLKGIVFEDIGVAKIIENLEMNIQKIYFPNHMLCNYEAINGYLEIFDSVLISNELTKEEIKTIINKVNKGIILSVFGYNQIMYSRRLLISNFAKQYNLKLAKESRIQEKNSKKILRIKENDYGTVLFDEKIYNNLELLELDCDKIKFFYINATDIQAKVLKQVLDKKIILPNSCNGFLNRKTIYKIGDIDE